MFGRDAKAGIAWADLRVLSVSAMARGAGWAIAWDLRVLVIILSGSGISPRQMRLRFAW